MKGTQNSGDFSKGKIWKHIAALAVPMTVAQLVQVVYNIVDRIYIGHLPGASSLALTGLGLTFPVITLIAAFTNLFGMGGAPLCSIARGRHESGRAEKIIGSTFTMLCITSVFLMAVSYLFLKPILYLFGASDETFPYAQQYLQIYLIGTPFVMLGTGMNGFINSQGFARTGMMTILLGAVVNIVLDPIFIFGFGMGVAGAATATVLSQLLSALWVLRFLTGPKTELRIKKGYLRPEPKLVKEITGLGLAGCIMSATNGAVQIACNATLGNYGGDLYVGIMTVLNSVRDVVMLPIQGLTGAFQPVLGYNYGAKEYGRVKQGIAFTTVACVVYTTLAWLLIFLFPEPFIKVFNSDPELIAQGVPAMHIYFFGFFMMAFQFAAQSTFVGMGQSKQAVFFSLFRKIIIVVPLTLLLPRLGLGVKGVFVAEPISNFLGGMASFGTMLVVVRKLIREGKSLENQ
ncbi:MAG: MATE family efflux transporter [Eubacteriales bacterium]|nr:MATE family efflux transporter [Eubacteriales bacterium]